MHIHGSICALATPFGDDGAVDLDAFERLIGHQLEQGTQALVVAGSTGEAHMLGDDEFPRLLQHAVKLVNGRVPVIAGCGSAATSRTIAACRQVAELGIDAALVVTPYYVRPDQRGLEHHFRSVADDGSLPIILYNVPSRTACDMLPETVAALRDHPRIIGIKEAVSDSERIRAMSDLASDDFVFLSGDDSTAVDAMLAGAGGTVSVVANAVPRLFRAACDAALEGKRELAAEARQRLQPLLAALGCAPNPVPIKACLAAMDICLERVRSPLLTLQDEGARQRLRELTVSLQA
ncbi:MAG: 4-hydroxy-tetrahydrodipicolinate synthase [Rhodanobacteraceae bacterium]